MIIYNVYKYGAKRSTQVNVFQRFKAIDSIVND
jgi:hypothetical protein